MTLYWVLPVKHIDGGDTYVTVDGGMGDNPQVAHYEVVVANRHPCGPHMTTTVAGRYCEAGDILATEVRLSADLRPGEVLPVACNGVHHYSLASTYNSIGRPPIVAVHQGRCRELVRRETTADPLAREIG